MFPALINKCANMICWPLSAIYNQVLISYVWPITWKREHVTIIPKKTMPESFSDLRNISCTLFVSKILETYVMLCIMEEISLKPNQFRGTKGCSTTHMVIEILQEICENAEDYRSATVMAAIDYSKAFNRVSYQHCLQAFKRKGASTPILRLLATFLTNRTMTVRVGSHWSDPLPVSGGCPQGSILGVVLFNTTTDNLEDDLIKANRIHIGLDQADDQNVSNESNKVFIEEEGRPQEPVTSSPDGPSIPANFSGSPIHDARYRLGSRDIVFNPRVVNVPVPPPVLLTPPQELRTGTQVWFDKLVKVFKYVDDNLSCEKLNFGTTPITNVSGNSIKLK